MGTRHPSGLGSALEAGDWVEGLAGRPRAWSLSGGKQGARGAGRKQVPTSRPLDEVSWGVNTSPREKRPDIYILDKLV